MNQEELKEFKENFVEYVLSDMDEHTLQQLVYDLLYDKYESCSEDEMIEQVKDLYDENTLIDLLP